MDILAGLFELMGKYFVGEKARIGFVFHIIGSIFWTVIALRASIYGLLIITIPAFFLNIINFIKWSKKNDSCKRNVR